MKAGKRQLPALTGMRCFLALWVVIFHQFSPVDGLRIPWLPRAPDAACSVLWTGYISVTVFFVLSGFVLSYNYDLGTKWSRQDKVKFGIARFSRIYPAYFLGLTLLIPFAAYRLSNGFSFPRMASEGGVAFLNWTLVQAWLPQTAVTWNYPGWSLSNEAFFYACFPFMGVPLWRIGRVRALILAGIALWIASVLAPIWAVAHPVAGFGNVPAAPAPAYGSDWANAIRYNPLIRLPEFCVGILLGRAYSLVQRSRQEWLGKGYWLYLPGIFTAGSILSCANSIPYPLVHNGLLLPVYASILFGLALDGGFLGRILSSGILVFLGNASYSMYILHAPIASWLRMYWKYVLNSIPEGPAFVACYTVTVLVVSSVVYKFYEEPLNRLLKRKLGTWLAGARDTLAEATPNQENRRVANASAGTE